MNDKQMDKENKKDIAGAESVQRKDSVSGEKENALHELLFDYSRDEDKSKQTAHFKEALKSLSELSEKSEATDYYSLRTKKTAAEEKKEALLGLFFDYSEDEDKSEQTAHFKQALKSLSELADTPEVADYYEEVGRVVGLGDGIVLVRGLAHCMLNEMLLFENGEIGLALNLNRQSIGVVILGDYTHIEAGHMVRRSGKLLQVPVGEGFLGRVVNPLAEPLDGKGKIESKTARPVEFPAPDVMARQSVDRPLQTGVTAIDALIPIGRGQRELIIGDRKTGKTTLALDTIIRQRDEGVICVYVAIGQKESSVKEAIGILEAYGALDHTIVVMAAAGDSTALQYLAPYAGCAMAEYFMYRGQDVLIVYDDLTKHAVAYRELSLLLKRPPGREAYPGDVFYLHSRLLERAACLSGASGGGSLTALPIIETQYGDVSAYIPTNVISITDGQIFLDADLFKDGQRPAVSVGVSVSRVGGAAQVKAMKQVAGSLRLDLAQYRELREFTKFGTDFDDETAKRLKTGEIFMDLLVQKPHQLFSAGEEILFLYAGQQGFFDEVPAEDIFKWRRKISAHFKEQYGELLDRLAAGEKLEGDLEKEAAEGLNCVFKPLETMPYPDAVSGLESS